MFSIQVECYSGYRGEETPRMIRMGERIIRVVDLMDQWLAPDHRYFKIRGDDNGTYIIRHDPQRQCWQLVFYESQIVKGEPKS